jgi:hypothetical protein
VELVQPITTFVSSARKKGHFQVKCRANKSEVEKKEKTGEEAHHIFNVSSAWPETKF